MADRPTLSIAGMPVIAPDRVPEEWWHRSAAELTASVAQEDYPCHFGHRALLRGEMFATFFDDVPGQLDVALAIFLRLSRPTPRRRMVLAALRRPRPAGASTEDHDDFWAILQALHDVDPEPWARDTPQDPADPQWEYSFAGVPMFVFAGAPSYRRRASRNFGGSMVLLFQPRNVFTGIEGGTPAGIAARRQIRDRLAKWDTAPPHPDMGDYGDESNHEWRQYFLADDQSRLQEQCPLRLRAAEEALVGEPGARGPLDGPAGAP